MPTVYLPLASAEAYGAVGEMMIFQGQTCRAYVVPYDPRTEAQLDVRKLFYDVTKMQTFCGAWVKSAWKIAFGSRWYTSLYKRVTESGAARYNAAAAEWDGFTTEQKEAWNLAAPFKVTYNPPGEVFYVVMSVMSDWMIELGAPGYEFPGIDADNAAGIGEWAAWTLEDVLTAGSYEDSHALLTYVGSWSVISDAGASGGAYHQSATTGTPSVSFYFYGTQFSLVFEKNAGRGAASVAAFGMATQIVNQNDSVQTWQSEWLSVGLPKGLHYVTITRTGTGAINLDAIGISSRVIQTPAQTAIADTFVIPAVSLTRTINQNIPAYVSPGPFFAVQWDAEIFDNVGMHDLVVNAERVVCKVPGYYGVRCFLQFQKTAGAIVFRVELRLNGAIVALDDHLEEAAGTGPAYAEVARFLDLNADDYLEVWVRHTGSLQIPITPVADYAPVFEVQMFQRTTLQVANVNVTEQVGSSVHGEMEELGDDDHPQYLNEERGDDRYPLLGHQHKFVMLYPMHGLNGSIAAGATMELPPFLFGLNGTGYNSAAPGAGVLKNLSVTINSPQPGSGTLVFTVMVENVVSALLCTVPINAAAGAYVDVTHFPSVAAGARVRVQVKNNATAASAIIGAVSFLFEGVTVDT